MSEIHNDCSYCAEGELLNAFGIKICELPMSKLILFKEQSHPGRVIVACKKHVDDITELTADERAQYMEDINKVAVCIHKVFNPDKVNFGAYGDTMHHLHVLLLTLPLMSCCSCRKTVKKDTFRCRRHCPR